MAGEKEENGNFHKIRNIIKKVKHGNIFLFRVWIGNINCSNINYKKVNFSIIENGIIFQVVQRNWISIVLKNRLKEKLKIPSWKTCYFIIYYFSFFIFFYIFPFLIYVSIHEPFLVYLENIMRKFIETKWFIFFLFSLYFIWIFYRLMNKKLNLYFYCF